VFCRLVGNKDEISARAWQPKRVGAHRQWLTDVNSVVLDASALHAVLNSEGGAEKLTPELLSIATCSTVNLAEVQAKLLERGLSGGSDLSNFDLLCNPRN